MKSAVIEWYIESKQTKNTCLRMQAGQTRDWCLCGNGGEV